jgi:hypothetical protein
MSENAEIIGPAWQPPPQEFGDSQHKLGYVGRLGLDRLG